MNAILYIFLGFLFVMNTPSQANEFVYPALKQLDPAQDIPENAAVFLSDLNIYSTTDNAAMTQVIQDFQKQNPYITLTYHELQTLDLFEKVQTDKPSSGADLVISSAMDLQMKLVNDGYAQRVDLKLDYPFPKWAVWRNEIYGTTFEPAVMIYNQTYFKNRKRPTNRSELIRFLENKPEGIYGRVATYDVEKSGLGYLFLSRDDSQFNATWDLIRILGENNVQLLTQSHQIIEGVSTGRFVLGYNVLGTYAVSKLDENPDLGIILPDDYTTVFTRLAFIPKNAPSPSAGKLFLEYLLSPRGQELLTYKANLNGIHFGLKNDTPLFNRLQTDPQSLRPIRLSTGLLVYLDQLKKKKMLQRWRKSLNLEPL